MLSGFFVPVRLILILWSCNIQLQIHTKWIHHYTCHFITIASGTFTASSTPIEYLVSEWLFWNFRNS